MTYPEQAYSHFLMVLSYYLRIITFLAPVCSLNSPSSINDSSKAETREYPSPGHVPLGRVQFAHVPIREWCPGSPHFSSYHQRGPRSAATKTSITFCPIVLQPSRFSPFSTTTSDPNVVFILPHSSGVANISNLVQLGLRLVTSLLKHKESDLLVNGN